MASKSPRIAPARFPWAVVIPLAHVGLDLATHAACPACGNQVVLYFCTGCKKPVWPTRRAPSSA
jgi:hypothetical protein